MKVFRDASGCGIVVVFGRLEFRRDVGLPLRVDRLLYGYFSAILYNGVLWFGLIAGLVREDGVTIEILICVMLDGSRLVVWLASVGTVGFYVIVCFD